LPLLKKFKEIFNKNFPSSGFFVEKNRSKKTIIVIVMAEKNN
jgi:hypothetical protein